MGRGAWLANSRLDEHARAMKPVKKNIIQLEGLRGFAAIFVFMHHANLFAKAGIGTIFYFGQEAVILFFLLSGFVIYYSTKISPRSPLGTGTYLLHRFRRIYPVLILALLVSYLSECLQERAWVSPRLPSALANLLMLQDVSALKPGVWFDTYMNDSPLWSLSYEWWFYMLFIPLAIQRQVTDSRFYVAAGISLAGFATYAWWPNQVSLYAGYFIIWWAGVELARQYGRDGRVSFAGQSRSIGALTLFVILWSIPVLLARAHGQTLSLGIAPILQVRHFASALLILMVGVAWYRTGWALFRWTIGLFTVLAPISYSLYLMHYPVLKAVGSMMDADRPVLRALLAFVALVPLCYLSEVRLQRLWKRRSRAAAAFPLPKTENV